MRLKGNTSNIIKKGIAISLITVCLLQSALSASGLAYGANNYSMIGTNQALGSPVLDPNFVSDDWNKWEMLTWGIFLSNFATPLIDDYDSAFNTNSTTGSKGSGLKALQFGTGSDPANAETIKGLLKYAVDQQKQGGVTQLSVSFNTVKRDGFTKTAPPSGSLTPANNGVIRDATFKDLFLMSKGNSDESWVTLGDTDGLLSPNTDIVPIDGDSKNEGISQYIDSNDKYASVATINSGSIPTFYRKYGSGYETVLDYTDGWDAQILTAFIARVACGDFGTQFKDTFNDMWAQSNNLKLGMDTFGNIVTQYNGSRRIIIPASINQHLTATPKINLLSSMIFNGINSTVSGSDIVVNGQQSVSGWFGRDTLPIIGSTTAVRFGGLPALGSHLDNIPQGTLELYYDLDSIMYDTYFHGGAAANGNKTVSGESSSVYNTSYGKAVEELFNLDANKELGNDYTLKLEAANMDKFKFKDWSKDGKAKEALDNMLKASGKLANIAGKNPNVKILSKLKTNTTDQSLFSEPVIAPVQMDVGTTKNKTNSAGAERLFVNYIYQAYTKDKSTLAGDVKREYIKSMLETSESSSMMGFRKNILGVSSGTISQALAGFVADKDNELFKVNVDKTKLFGATITDMANPFEGMDNVKIDNKKATSLLFSTGTTINHFPGRLIKVYPTSEVMRAVGNVLGVREGTEFGLYSTYIYMTYLDWYGVKTDKLTKVVSSEFNPRIFDGTSDMLKADIKSIAKIKSQDDKKQDVLNYTYMMLHPTEGKDYRNEMMKSYINNFVYDNYQKIVYGNATSFYSNITSNLATRNATGFLSLESYSDNFMTAWFMKIYTRAAIIIIAIASILIILTGLLKGRKISWYVVALAVVINTVLVVPSAGELTPSIANNFVQNMFKSKMTYWGVSESVTNATMEKDYVNNTSISTGYVSSLSKDDQAKVVELVKTLNVVYLDRALMVKTDISRKITQAQSGNFAEVQSLKSVRWMLPMIMRQFTANDKSADYVYIPLGDMYDDVSNMYWLYKPADAQFSTTVNGQQQTTNTTSTTSTPSTAVVAAVEDPIKLADRKSYYPDYTDTASTSSTATIPYRSEAYYKGKPLDEMPHTYFYLLKTNANPLNRAFGFGGEYKGDKSFRDYVDTSLQAGKAQSFISTSVLIEQAAGTYNRFDRSTVKQSYGYLWSTESPYHYSYEAVKDCFDSDITLGSLVGKLQGQYIKKTDGSEVRTSFMHAGETGYIKDVTDLQELFTNMVPYLYEMQITAGGMDGKSGVLGDAKITEYDIYKNNNKSWMFRSNWATKLMESPEFTKSAIVRNKNGDRVKIKNPMLIDCYPADRPMVFSEAQMHELGLSESDLNIVELKAVKLNKDVSRRWTMLLNYANVKGMTKEVMLRQMATESVLAFDTAYSPSGLFNSSYSMYPSGLDLRAISFDSVMKMLMLNVTKDTTYIYGDTMQNVISDSDMLSATLLLISAFLCSYIIPLLRNLTMGLIFYLGFVAIIHSILASNLQKTKVSCGYLISNILFLIMTLIYYAVFSSLMAVTTSDAVLTVQSVQVNSGNPVWCFIIIIAASLVYIYGMFKMIDFCFKHYRDMGMEVYTSVAGMITEKVSGGMSSIGDKISNFGNENPSPSNQNRFRGSNGGLGHDDYNYNNDDRDRNDDINDARDREQSERNKDYDPKTYTYGDKYADDSEDAIEIDAEIERAKKARD